MAKDSKHLHDQHQGNQPPEEAAASGTAAEQHVSRAEFDEVSDRLAAAENELAEFKDKYLRALADNENARKRIRQQADESVRIQREELLRDFLPVVDNLERALEAARGGGNGKSILQGVELVLAMMRDYLKSHGVSSVAALGQPFDPKVHEAVALIESAEHEPNTVIGEHDRGYKVGDRTLRPARVSVAKAIEAKESDGSEE